VNKGDERYSRYVKQLKENGFSDTETWSLDSTISKFIIPRLKRFKEVNNGFPGGGDMTAEKWDVILDKIIFAFEFHLVADEWSGNKEGFDVEYAKYEEGMQLFAKWFGQLWW
jgi:hypothetical protein